MLKHSLKLSFVLTVALVAAWLPTATTQAASIVSLTDGPGCELHVTFEVLAGDPTGDYMVDVWDDLVQITAAKINVSGAGTYSVTLLVPNPNELGAPGMGVYLYDPSDYVTPIDEVDPFYPSNLDPACGAGPDMVPLPPQAVVGAVTSTTELYWAPNTDAHTGVQLEAGKTVWVLGVDASGMYYQIVLAGKYLWVPKETLGPNHDSLWGGRPLPTTIVN